MTTPDKQLADDKLTELVKRLAGGIAHDLNNVLMPIMMAVDLLKLKDTDDKSQELLNTISGSVRRGADAFLAKPYSAESLLNALHTLLHKPA